MAPSPLPPPTAQRHSPHPPRPQRSAPLRARAASCNRPARSAAGTYPPASEEAAKTRSRASASEHSTRPPVSPPLH
eukprot:4678754-Pleurochrysis_carterae.AAC.1